MSMMARATTEGFSKMATVMSETALINCNRPINEVMLLLDRLEGRNQSSGDMLETPAPHQAAAATPLSAQQPRRVAFSPAEAPTVGAELPVFT
ncbi:TPA: hypothetical protein ACH3X1_014705 [Trebouxia sp. C0004]